MGNRKPKDRRSTPKATAFSPKPESTRHRQKTNTSLLNHERNSEAIPSTNRKQRVKARALTEMATRIFDTIRKTYHITFKLDWAPRLNKPLLQKPLPSLASACASLLVPHATKRQMVTMRETGRAATQPLLFDRPKTVCPFDWRRPRSACQRPLIGPFRGAAPFELFFFWFFSFFVFGFVDGAGVGCSSSPTFLLAVCARPLAGNR